MKNTQKLQEGLLEVEEDDEESLRKVSLFRSEIPCTSFEKNLVMP